MRRARLLAALGSLCALAALALGAARRRPTPAHAGDPPPASAAPAARLAVVSGDVDGDFADVAILDLAPGATSAKPRALGRVEHVHASARRGAILGGAFGEEAALVVVDEPGDRRSGFRAALFRVEHGKATRLCGGVARRATPIVTRSGRVLIERGEDGPEPEAEASRRLELRSDALRVDEIDPWTGSITPRWSGRGYTAHLAATIGLDASGGGVEELAVYFVTAAGAKLLALDPATGRARTLAEALLPFARDFSWDAPHARLVFADLPARGAVHAHVLTLDPLDGAQRVLLASPHDHPAPRALADGALAYAGDDGGLAIAPSGGRARALAPLGAGVDQAVAASPDGRWIAVRHTPEPAKIGEPPRTVALDAATGRVVAIDLPASQEVEALGFLAGEGR